MPEWALLESIGVMHLADIIFCRVGLEPLAHYAENYNSFDLTKASDYH
jgi:hypothetical protein